MKIWFFGALVFLLCLQSIARAEQISAYEILSESTRVFLLKRAAAVTKGAYVCKIAGRNIAAGKIIALDSSWDLYSKIRRRI